MSLLAQGEAWLRTKRAAQAREIVYSRGVDSVELTAVQARSRAQSDVGGEVIIDSSHADWLIERADLELGGVLVVPAHGDRIEVDLEHGTEAFLVAPYNGEPAWKWHGRDGGTFRIHTVRIGYEPEVPADSITADSMVTTADNMILTVDAA